MYDPIEDLLKENLQVKGNRIPEKTPSCPSARELWDYLNGLQKLAEEKIARHLVGCRYCLESLLLAQEVRPGIGFDPSSGPREATVAKAVQLGQGKPAISKTKKNGWLILSLLSIGLSFFIPRYFVQWLILGTLFGLKWIFDTMTTRTLIVMYDALKKKRSQESEELKESLRPRE